MGRHRNFLMAGGTLFLALGAGQYMASGTAQSTAAMIPVPPVTTSSTNLALRPAAATPLSGHEVAPVPEVIIPAAATPDHVWSRSNAVQTGTVTDPCPVSLDVFTGDDATLSVSVSAACAVNQPIVLSHAGLAVTYQTTASGAFFADIPALDAKGEVTIRLLDGREMSSSSSVPEMAGISRLVVQGMADDRFTLNADLQLSTLGESTGPVPMLAHVATWRNGEDPPITIEAEVTPTVCGRELIGELILSEGGKITRADLTLAMPDCDGEGGFVALNNPLSDMKLATTE